jgi:hypothetical protein
MFTLLCYILTVIRIDMAALNGSTNGTRVFEDIEIGPYIFGILIALIAVILNGFLLLVLVKERKSFLHMRVTYYIMNLGIADFLTGLIILFLAMTRVFHIEIPSTCEDVMVILNWITMQCSFYTLVMMSIDRLVIVLYSLSWSNILTVRRTIISIITLWLVSIAGGIVMYFYQLETRLAILSFVELSIFIFICNSLFIYPVLRKREKGSIVTTVSSSQTVYSTRVLYPLPYDNMSRVVIILILVLIITQLPFIICLQMWLIHKLSGGSVLVDVVRTQSFFTGYGYAQAFASLNFAMNPIVYAWRVKKYREAFADTLC